MKLELAAHVDHGIIHSPAEAAQLQHALENAKLADNVYKDDGSAPPGFTRVKEWNDPATHMKAVAYRSNLDGHVVVAFRGTQNWQDWAANISQGLGNYTPRYAEAAAIGREAQSLYGNSVEFTGHSLGGGQAAAAALATGSHADTFNAAGLNPMSYPEYGLNPFNAKNIESWNQSTPKCHKYRGTPVQVTTNVPMRKELLVQLIREAGRRNGMIESV